MIQTAAVVMPTLLAIVFSVNAGIFPIYIQKGGAEIIRGETGEQVIVTDTAKAFPGDMVSLAEGQLAAVSLEKNSMALIKGPASLSLSTLGNTMNIGLDDGQVLLIRKQPYKFSSVTVAAGGYSFLPMGTVAAIKTTSDAKPTTAVVEGRVRMQAPSGEAVVVEEGNYGSVDAGGKLTTGPLSPRAMESLKDWLASAPIKTSLADPSSATAAVPPPAPGAAAQKQSASSPTQTTPPAAGSAESASAGHSGSASSEAVKRENESPPPPPEASRPSARDVEKTPPPPASPKWEISAGTATVENEQWTRLALGFDLPIWKFGIFFDVELFADNAGRFSGKGWNFRDEPLEALTRKIRYIRFGQEGEPLFIKFGGLSSVSLGYGFLVDRFTNMLHYPDQKLPGFQFDLNDISPVGITLQTLVADFKDFDIDGGILAARLAFRPLKMTGIPVINGIAFGGSYATDLNQYAPARKWDFTMRGTIHDRDLDGITDSSFYHDRFGGLSFYDSVIQASRSAGDFDTVIEHRDQWASRRNDPFGLIGGDIGIPILATELLGLDLYGQAGLRDDGKHGWGIGAPGIALKVWRVWANVEYRRVLGLFQPGYFGVYYLDERLMRHPAVTTKEQRLVSDTLNGAFGRLGLNIADVLLFEGHYQYMVGRQERSKDQRFEAIGSLGDLLLNKIPKLNRAEVYYYKSRIGSEDDRFFEKTPFMYFGYRAGFEIAAGASLIWDARYGYKRDENGNLAANNNISVQTAISF